MLEKEEFDFVYRDLEEECVWSNQRLRMFYPCIRFVTKRIEEANLFGMGVSVWDAGQAPHFYYHLF